jgi:hypothetical protein
VQVGLYYFLSSVFHDSLIPIHCPWWSILIDHPTHLPLNQPGSHLIHCTRRHTSTFSAQLVILIKPTRIVPTHEIFSTIHEHLLWRSTFHTTLRIAVAFVALSLNALTSHHTPNGSRARRAPFVRFSLSQRLRDKQRFIRRSGSNSREFSRAARWGRGTRDQPSIKHRSRRARPKKRVLRVPVSVRAL